MALHATTTSEQFRKNGSLPCVAFVSDKLSQHSIDTPGLVVTGLSVRGLNAIVKLSHIFISMDKCCKFGALHVLEVHNGHIQI